MFDGHLNICQIFAFHLLICWGWFSNPFSEIFSFFDFSGTIVPTSAQQQQLQQQQQQQPMMAQQQQMQHAGGGGGGFQLPNVEQMTATATSVSYLPPWFLPLLSRYLIVLHTFNWFHEIFFKWTETLFFRFSTLQCSILYYTDIFSFFLFCFANIPWNQLF